MNFGANKTPVEVITLSVKISSYLCSYFGGGSPEMHFLRKQLFQFLDSWLLINVAVLL